MQRWLNGLTSGVLNINSCCVPEMDGRDAEVVASLVSKHPGGKGSAKAPFHSKDMGKKPRGKYSGFLLRAAERGDETLLMAALKVEEDLIEGQDPSGNTALHLAARHGHTRICDLLCQVKKFVLANATRRNITFLRSEQRQRCRSNACPSRERAAGLQPV